MTDTATLITQLRILGQLTRTEAQVARQRVVQASTSAVRDELRQNAADADGRAARIADALRGLGALPDLVTPLLGRVAVLVRGAMEQAQPLDEALLGDLALEHQLRDRARYVAALAAAADVPAVQTLAGELEAAHDGTVRWLTSVLADLAGGQAALEASPLQRVAAQVTRAANAPSRSALHDAGAMVTRTVETVTAVGTEVGKDVKDTAEQYAGRAARLGVEAADAVVATGREAAAQVSEATGHFAGAPAKTAGPHARPLPGSGPPDAPEDAAPTADTELIAPPIPGFADLPPHAAVAALRTLDDPRAVAAMLEFEQAHGNRPGVVAAARLRATAVRTG
ncbi:MAG: ferritin-like domain-containing protein [Pseudonocardia sp.]